MSNNTKEKTSLPFFYQFLAGAVAGVSEILVMYPLDVVKTRMQLQVNGATSSSNYTGVVDCLEKIVAKEGFNKLYKGISSPILMEAPKRATKFACNDEFQKIYKRVFGVQQMSQPLSMLSGASAGCIEAFVVVPFELVKIRLQDVSSRYNTPLDVIKQIYRNEGILAIYSGLESTIWRHGIWNTGYFGLIFHVRSILPKPENNTQNIRNDLISGTLGGTVGCIFSTPFDVVKSRIQNTALVPGKLRKYNWSWTSIFTIYREEGLRALYKGFVPKVLRLGPGGGILLVVFTGVLDFLSRIHA